MGVETEGWCCRQAFALASVVLPELPAGSVDATQQTNLGVTDNNFHPRVGGYIGCQWAGIEGALGLEGLVFLQLKSQPCFNRRHGVVDNAKR